MPPTCNSPFGNGSDTDEFHQPGQGGDRRDLNLYGLVLDARRWDLFDRVFTDDVLAEFGPAGAAWTGLTDFMTSFAEFHATLDSHQHTLMGQVVTVTGDEAHAFSYGNWLLVRHAAEGGPIWQGTGWYDDTLVRTDAGWRIGHRVCRLMSWTGTPRSQNRRAITTPT